MDQETLKELTELAERELRGWPLDQVAVTEASDPTRPQRFYMWVSARLPKKLNGRRHAQAPHAVGAHGDRRHAVIAAAHDLRCFLREYGYERAVGHGAEADPG